MDTDKNKPLSSHEAALEGQYHSTEAEPEKESVESLVPKKHTRKKRPASEASEIEEAGDPGQSANEKSRPKKRTFRPMKVVTAKSGSAIEPEDASDNVEDKGVVTTSTKKRRKPPKAPTGPKGNWTEEEDNLILQLKKEGKSWQDITNLVRAAGSPETDRTLTAVRLRYQKVLKDRDIELTTKELDLLKQAETEVLTTDKYRYITERYKQLSGNELSKGACQKILALSKKGGSSVLEGGGESSKE